VGNGRFNFGLEVKDPFLGRSGTTSAVKAVTPPKLTAKQTRTQLPYLKCRLTACAGEKKLNFYSFMLGSIELLLFILKYRNFVEKLSVTCQLIIRKNYIDKNYNYIK
jgi:hypothetical protein